MLLEPNPQRYLGRIQDFGQGAPEGGALSPQFAYSRFSPLKLPENCMILKKKLGARGPPGCPLDPVVVNVTSTPNRLTLQKSQVRPLLSDLLTKKRNPHRVWMLYSAVAVHISMANCLQVPTCSLRCQYAGVTSVCSKHVSDINTAH